MEIDVAATLENLFPFRKLILTDLEEQPPAQPTSAAASPAARVGTVRRPRGRPRLNFSISRKGPDSRGGLSLLLLLILLVPGSALAGAAPALWREGSLGGEEDGEGGGGD